MKIKQLVWIKKENEYHGSIGGSMHAVEYLIKYCNIEKRYSLFRNEAKHNISYWRIDREATTLEEAKINAQRNLEKIVKEFFIEKENK